MNKNILALTLLSSFDQSYALICMVPKRSLLKTGIPGWLWRGMTLFGGIQKIPICNNQANEYQSHVKISLIWEIGKIFRGECVLRICHTHGDEDTLWRELVRCWKTAYSATALRRLRSCHLQPLQFVIISRFHHKIHVIWQAKLLQSNRARMVFCIVLH